MNKTVSILMAAVLMFTLIVAPAQAHGVSTHELVLAEGWNLISVPLTPENVGVFNGFTMWQYDGERYKPPTFEAGVGYWILADTAANVTVEGTQVHNVTLHLLTGWNLIGIPAGLTETDPNIVFSTVTDYLLWTYDAAAKKYVVVETLEAGKGYWLASPINVDVVLPLEDGS